MRSIATLTAVLVAGGLTGCGTPAEDALSETIDNLATIRSGELDMSLAIAAGGDGGGDVGFELSGPFALPDQAGELPEAEITYTQLAGAESASVTLVSSPEGAVVEVDGVEQEIPPDRVAELEAASAPGSSPAELPDIADWFVDPTIAPDDSEDGEAIERIEGALDVPNAVAGLVEIISELDGGSGGAAPTLKTAAEDLDDGTTGRFTLETGAEDRLLRSVSLEITLPLDQSARSLLATPQTEPPQELEVKFDLSIKAPNAR